MKTTLSKSLLFCLMFLFIISSCKKDDFNMDKLTSSDWNPNIAVPLVKATFDVYDVLARTDSSDLVVIDPATGFIALVYKGGIFSLDANEIVEMPNQNFNSTYGMTGQQIVDYNLGSPVTFSQNGNYTFSSNFGVKLTEVKFEMGSLTFDLSSSFPANSSLRIRIPSLTLNGVAFDETIQFNYSGNVPITRTLTKDLSNYILDLSASTPGNFNDLQVNYTVTVSSSSNVLNGTENIQISTNLTSLAYEYARGDFGQQLVGADDDSIMVKIFNQVIDGYFEFTNPKARLSIINTFGFPIRINLSNIASTNTQTNVITPILLNNFQNPFTINHPSTMGASAVTNVQIDKTNSNITDLITPAPKILSYNLQGTSNPAGAVTNFDNFITKNSRFVVESELELPMEGFAYGFYILDTLDINLSDDIQEIESVMFRLNFTNGFPVDLEAQVWFVDSNFVVLDTLLTSADKRLVPSGIKNSQGRVVTPTNKITDITYDRSRIPNVFRAKYIIIRADGETNRGANNPPDIIKIYDNDRIDFRLGMQVKGKIGF
jgi:hypothetical protein